MGLCGGSGVTCYDILEATLRRTHLTPYDPEEAAEDGIGCGRCCPSAEIIPARTTMTELTHVSLFSGIGGLDLAAEAAGFETVCQCEWADYPYSVSAKHGRMCRGSGTSLLSRRRRFLKKQDLKPVTVISGGFPCQPFSTAGKRKGFADERYLWPEMCRVITELRPRWVLGENVAGFINMGLDKTIFDLAKAGYAVLPFVFPACGVGAWHERQRTFIVAADVSHAPCLRQEHRRDAANLDVFLSDNGIFRKRNETGDLEPEPVGGGVLSDPGSVGGLPLHAETGGVSEQRPVCQPVSAGDPAGAAGIRDGGAEPGLGGMAHGLPRKWTDVSSGTPSRRESPASPKTPQTAPSG